MDELYRVVYLFGCFSIGYFLGKFIVEVFLDKGDDE